METTGRIRIEGGVRVSGLFRVGFNSKGSCGGPENGRTQGLVAEPSEASKEKKRMKLGIELLDFRV